MSQTTGKMTNLTLLLATMDADPRSHLAAAAIPMVVAEMIRAWRMPVGCHTLEDKIAGVLDAGAVAMADAAGIDLESGRCKQ